MADTHIDQPEAGNRRPLPPGRSRPKRLLLWIAALVVAVPVMYLGGKAVAAALWPWSAAWLGRPTLTGEWVGGFATGDGRPHAAYLRLELAASPDADGNLKGAARFCAGPAADEYALHGRTQSRDGRRFTLEVGEPEFVEAGTRVSGAWAGDTIVLHYQPPRYDQHGNPLNPPPAPPIRLYRAAGAGFIDLCRGLLRR